MVGNLLLNTVRALPALFERFPELRFAVPVEEIRNLPVLTQNELAVFPVYLARRAQLVRAAYPSGSLCGGQLITVSSSRSRVSRKVMRPDEATRVSG